VPQEIDLNEMFGKRAAISIDPEETSEAHSARIKKEADEAKFELVKGYVLFFVIVVVIILLGILCVYEAVFDQTASPETKRMAWTWLSSLFTGSITFILGQKSVKTK
jgi:hypothetical protein